MFAGELADSGPFDNRTAACLSVQKSDIVRLWVALVLGKVQITRSEK